jgi:DtxR family Mn-dependent transcriptional regulator
VALGDLPPGRMAEVVHVEDEPEAVYAQLLASGIYPGMRVRVLERTPQRIRFESDTDEHVLAPVIAANVTAVELPDSADELTAHTRLSSIAEGEQARVVGIADACRRAERRRLLDLGVVPGTVITSELSTAGGDPVAYRIRGALIALRRDQSEMIHVEAVERGVTE